MRSRLIAARREKGLTQRELAKEVGVRYATIADWEQGKSTPDPIHVPKIRGILESQDPHLFDVDSPVESWTLKDIAEMLRRHLITKLGAAFGLVPMLANMSFAIVSTPVVEPAEYLAQARLAIDTAWRELNSGNFPEVERILNAHVSSLTRFAYILSPFQEQAAAFAVEAKILQALLASRDIQFGQRELYCIEAVQLGALSSDRNLLALAQYWYGDTYTYCYNRPQTAIPLLNDALSNVDGNSFLRARICSNLSIAHAQSRDESNALDYVEMAYSAMPSHHIQSPLYRYGIAELNRKEGRAYLFLAELLGNGIYARQAYDLSEKSIGQAATKGYRIQALICKADAARLLNEKSECINNLTQAYEKVSSTELLIQISDVLSRMPSDWQCSIPVSNLQEEVSNALVVARA